MQEGAAAAGGEEMDAELGRRVAVVVMPVAGEHGADLGPAHARDRRDLEEVLLLVLALEIGEHPGRLGHADDKLVVGAHFRRDRHEVVDLSDVEVFRELDIGAPDPPLVRQLQRPVAAVLLALPAADQVAAALGQPVARGAEQAVERLQTVVPVVIAGNCEQLALRLVAGQREGIGVLQPLAVFRPGRLRIALVAAHDQDIAVRQRARASQLQAILGEQVGHGIGRLEAVADVADVVDPECAGIVDGDALRRIAAGGAAVVVALHEIASDRRIGGRLDQPLVGILAEHRRYQRAHAHPRQQSRIVPANHLRQVTVDELLHRTFVHGTPSER